VPDTAPGAETAGVLALGPAASMLGVDRDTLRRWADAGRIRSFTTPGGHRRFARLDVERLMAAKRAGRTSLAALGATPERIARAYGRQYRDGAGAPAAVAADGPEREAFRSDGRRLVEALLAYLDAAGPAEKARLEAEANAIVDQTAGRLAAAAMTTAEATAAFVAARAPFLAALEALGRRRSLDAPAVMRLYAEAATLLDRLLVRFVAAVQPRVPALHSHLPPQSRGLR
jgi:excisionase family DNA binding protein